MFYRYKLRPNEKFAKVAKEIRSKVDKIKWVERYFVFVHDVHVM